MLTSILFWIRPFGESILLFFDIYIATFILVINFHQRHKFLSSQKGQFFFDVWFRLTSIWWKFECSADHHRYAIFVIFKASLPVPLSLSYWHFRCVLNTPRSSACEKCLQRWFCSESLLGKTEPVIMCWTIVFGLNN